MQMEPLRKQLAELTNEYSLAKKSLDHVKQLIQQKNTDLIDVTIFLQKVMNS
jgi:hypothetical protein